MGRSAMLEVFDAATTVGRIYRCLSAHPNSSAAEVSEHTGLGERVVEDALAELAEVGIAHRDGTSWEVERPELVALEMRRQEEDRQAQLRKAERELAHIYWIARRDLGRYAMAEVIEESAALFARVRRLQLDAARQVRCVNQPPYIGDADYRRAQEELRCSRMADGVEYQTIYHESAADDPTIGASMARTVAAGEQAKVLNDPPLKLVIGDDQLAIMPFDPVGQVRCMAMVVHPSRMLDNLTNVFETLWRLAMPVSARLRHDTVPEDSQELISLMAAGATDDVIARRLGLSRRTVARKVATLLEHLGATTRFQAGVQIARREWLG